jgi:hypothetical protein
MPITSRAHTLEVKERKKNHSLPSRTKGPHDRSGQGLAASWRAHGLAAGAGADSPPMASGAGAES